MHPLLRVMTLTISLALAACGGGEVTVEVDTSVATTTTTTSGCVGLSVLGGCGGGHVPPPPLAAVVSVQDSEAFPQQPHTVTANYSPSTLGFIGTFSWRQVAGPPVAFTIATTGNHSILSFVTPAVTARTELRFEVSAWGITDLDTASATVVVAVVRPVRLRLTYLQPAATVDGWRFDLGELRPMRFVHAKIETWGVLANGQQGFIVLFDGFSDAEGNVDYDFFPGRKVDVAVYANVEHPFASVWVSDAGSGGMISAHRNLSVAPTPGTDVMPLTFDDQTDALAGERGGVGGAFAILDALLETAMQYRQNYWGWSSKAFLSVRWQRDRTPIRPAVPLQPPWQRLFVSGPFSADDDTYDRDVLAHLYCRWNLGQVVGLRTDDLVPAPGETVRSPAWRDQVAPIYLEGHDEALDARVAFAGGFCDAIAAQVSGTPLDLEADVLSSQPWTRRAAIARVVHDLMDGGANDDDGLALPGSVLFSALADLQRQLLDSGGREPYTIYALADQLRASLPAAAQPRLLAVLAAQGFQTTGLDALGGADTPDSLLDGEQHPPFVIVESDGTPARVCVSSANGTGNKWGDRQMVAVRNSNSGAYRLTLRAIDGDSRGYLTRLPHVSNSSDDVVPVYRTEDGTATNVFLFLAGPELPRDFGPGVRFAFFEVGHPDALTVAGPGARACYEMVVVPN